MCDKTRLLMVIVHYVLLNNGHKFYTTCDWKDIDKLDPTATCAFRPLRTYECLLNNDPGAP
jgi:hypothetical protein